MIFLLWLALGVVLVGAVAYAMHFKHREEMPEELRGDWWTRFESEFRAYARRWEAAGGARQEGHRSGPRPPRQRHGRDLAEGTF